MWGTTIRRFTAALDRGGRQRVGWICPSAALPDRIARGPDPARDRRGVTRVFTES